MTEHIIVGDTSAFKNCLITVVHGDRHFAEKVLERMLYAPTETDLILMQGHKNIRIKEVVEEDQWWNDKVLAN